jgi:ABC-type dipeptide/oligopeptide/nickel transport system permease subunit
MTDDPRLDPHFDARLSELISDAADGVEPREGLTAIRSRTRPDPKETPMSRNSSRNWLYAVSGAMVGTAAVIIAIAVVSWPPMARLVRGDFLAMRDREFVLACVSMGMSNARFILRHILPNTLSSIIVTASLMVATAILIESSLSFLGLSDPNVMSWGFIIGAGRTAIRTAWWVCAIPGIAILLTVMSINLVGEGLNDALNPRLRTL